MTWARPDLLALLLAVPIVLVAVVLAERARRRVLAVFAALETLPLLVNSGVTRARTLQAVCAVLAASGLVLAAAGPRLGFEWQQQSVEGVSIAVVLDVSRSMDAADVSPSRLERARREILDLAGLLRGDAVALVIFAAGPYVRIPLTVDYDTFLWAVEDSSSDTIRAQGTALAGALEAAVGLLGNASGSGKAILVVSDGEGHDESAALDAALAAARDAEVRVYALGIGDPGGAPIPLPEGGFKKDASGSVVLSRLDEAALERLASATGGAYVRAVPSDDDVRALYVDEIRGKLDAAERGVRREKLWHERFQWPLALALAAMLGSAALGIGRRSRSGAGRAVAAAGLVFALTFSPRAEAGAREDGIAALRAQQWARAAELLGQARVDDPTDVAVSQGLGEALYRAGRFREAEQLFKTLAEQDSENKAVHLYNAGNAAYRGGRLADAARSFRGAVAADPALAAAQSNADAVEKEIAARTKPPPPEDAQDQGSGQGDSEDPGQGSASEQSGDAQPGEDGQASEGGEAGAGSKADGEAAPGGQSPNPAGQGPQPDGSGGDAAATPGEGTPPGGAGQTGDDGGERQPGEATPAVGDEEGGAGEGEELSGEVGEPGSDASGGGGGGSASPGAMTPEQAARLVDSIPDGKPRVVVGGSGTEKDW